MYICSIENVSTATLRPQVSCNFGWVCGVWVCGVEVRLWVCVWVWVGGVCGVCVCVGGVCVCVLP